MGKTKEDFEKLKQEVKNIGKGIPKKSKHVLWNCWPSKENTDSRGRPYTQFGFAITDKRKAYREITRGKLIDMLSEQNSNVIQIGSDVEFSVKNSEWGLLFVVYDACRNLQDLNFKQRGIIAKRDFNFNREKTISLEDYLRTRYT